MKFALIENKTMRVVNIIIWNGAEYLPPRDHFVVRSDEANMGDTYDALTNTFTSTETE